MAGVDRGAAGPARLTAGQREALTRAGEIEPGGGFCTSWVRHRTGLTQAQAYRAMRGLAVRGLVQDMGCGHWRMHLRGRLWLADAGRAALEGGAGGGGGDAAE